MKPVQIIASSKASIKILRESLRLKVEECGSAVLTGFQPPMSIAPLWTGVHIVPQLISRSSKSLVRLYAPISGDPFAHVAKTPLEAECEVR